ncbi:PAS domain S-box protein [Halorubrum sp. BOL3-1]|uniref:PAS domain S-box protein n=1 Tax=Halorubrum sp. BOL3-1 TaxID=2497325 RepID=UPI00140A0409|nr:PAS domain S-box protein [Halorubrum sp. BOL3-1]
MTDDGERLRLLVADSDAAFADAAADAIEEVNPGAEVETATKGGSAIRRASGSDALDGIIVGDALERPTEVIERLDERTDLPVVYITEGTADRSTITNAVRAGADDYFPRTTASAQYAVVTDIITDSSRTGAPATDASAAVQTTESSDRSSERDKSFGREFRTVFENVSDGLILHDPTTGEILEVNERFCEMNGYDREELVGENVGILTPPEKEYSYEAAQEKIQAAREEGPQLFEWQNQRKDCQRFPVEVHLSVIQFDGEERVLASVRDISTRKRREREFEQIFNSVNDSIVVHDLETAELTEVNDTFCDLLGYDRDEVLERGTAGVSVREKGYTTDRAEEIVAEVRETGQKGPFEWKVETADGDHRLLEVTATAAEIGGERRHVSLMRDITERKRREREYEQIFNGVNDGITIHDPNTGRILDANQTYLDIFAYDDIKTVRDLGIEGLSVTEEGYTEERAKYLISDVVSSGEPRTVEWRIKTADGEQRWFESTVAPAEIGGEKRGLAIQRDITERKRREREYEQIFNGVNDGIAIQDPETAEVLDVNQTYVERLGYENVEEALEQGYSGLAATETGYTREKARALCHRVMETGEPETVEWQLETKAGDRLWIEATVSPAVIGGEDRIVSIQRDITERRRLERRLRTITERIDEVVYLANADLSEALYVNSAYADLFGRPADELYEDPKAYFDAVLPEDKESFESVVTAMRDDIESGDPNDRYELEYRIRRPDGEVRRVKTTGYPVLSETSDSHRCVNVTEDITDRRARDQRLSVLNRVLRHNVRNGLDVVLAHADRIDDDDVRAEIRDRATELLELSRRAREAEEIMAVTTDPPERIDLTELAGHVVSRVRDGDHSGEITLDCPNELSIPAHRIVVRRILAELVENSLTHTDKDTPRVEIGIRQHAEAEVEITVADDGPGIPDQERQILTAETETQLEHGRGIGLWFVNWAVTQMGGELYYQPNTPEGSVVTIRI